MNYRENPITRRSSTRQVQIDIGLRSHMLKVYNYMALALVITGLVAFAVASSPQMLKSIFGTPLKWVVIFAPVAVAFFFSFRIHSMSYSTAQLVFWLYAALMGLSLSVLFVMFTGQSVARVFFITAGTFAATSLYGYTTQRDLSSFGSFLFMGVIGIFLASIVNIFLKSSALHFAISVIGVLVFIGLTAYDTQTIRQSYLEEDSAEISGKKAIIGALHLYMDFVNLFVFLLNLLGEKKE